MAESQILATAVTTLAAASHYKHTRRPAAVKLLGFLHIMDIQLEQHRQFMIHAATIAVNVSVQATIIYSTSHYDRIPYHTSALTGAALVTELMNGHPEHICCELGVHLHVFKIIIEYLKVIGYTHSKEVFLEEQLAIFLY